MTSQLHSCNRRLAALYTLYSSAAQDKLPLLVQTLALCFWLEKLFCTFRSWVMLLCILAIVYYSPTKRAFRSICINFELFLKKSFSLINGWWRDMRASERGCRANQEQRKWKQIVSIIKYTFHAKREVLARVSKRKSKYAQYLNEESLLATICVKGPTRATSKQPSPSFFHYDCVWHSASLLLQKKKKRACTLELFAIVE